MDEWMRALDGNVFIVHWNVPCWIMIGWRVVDWPLYSSSLRQQGPVRHQHLREPDLRADGRDLVREEHVSATPAASGLAFQGEWQLTDQWSCFLRLFCSQVEGLVGKDNLTGHRECEISQTRIATNHVSYKCSPLKIRNLFFFSIPGMCLH